MCSCALIAGKVHKHTCTIIRGSISRVCVLTFSSFSARLLYKNIKALLIVHFLRKITNKLIQRVYKIVFFVHVLHVLLNNVNGDLTCGAAARANESFVGEDADAKFYYNSTLRTVELRLVARVPEGYF